MKTEVGSTNKHKGNIAVTTSDTFKLNELNAKYNAIKYCIKVVLDTLNEAENDSAVDLNGAAGGYFDIIKRTLEGVNEL